MIEDELTEQIKSLVFLPHIDRFVKFRSSGTLISNLTKSPLVLSLCLRASVVNLSKFRIVQQITTRKLCRGTIKYFATRLQRCSTAGRQKNTRNTKKAKAFDRLSCEFCASLWPIDLEG